MQKNIRKYWPVFLLPTLAAFLIGFVIPFCQGLYLSLCKFTTINKATFVGFSNYVKAFQDELFTNAFWFTAKFTVVSTILINILALGIALLLTRSIKGTTAFRTVFFMPNLIGGIVLGYIWQILLNCVLSLVGKPLLSLNATYGYWGLIILMCWQQIGYMMIIYIAGLQSIPNDYIEAAYIDGATPWQTFWKITFPLLTPYIILNTVYSIIDSFTFYDNPVMQKVNELFSAMSYGTASALSMAYFLLIFLLTAAVLFFTSRRAFYQEK